MDLTFFASLQNLFALNSLIRNKLIQSVPYLTNSIFLILGISLISPYDKDIYRNPLAFTGLFRSEKNQVILPVSSYLIEHPHGLILIDTGWNKLVRQSNWKELGPQIQINTGYLPMGWSVDERLAALGYKPLDIDYLLLSHLHCDHVSGLKQVKDAKNILVSEPELRQTTNAFTIISF